LKVQPLPKKQYPGSLGRRHVPNKYMRSWPRLDGEAEAFLAQISFGRPFRPRNHSEWRESELVTSPVAFISNNASRVTDQRRLSNLPCCLIKEWGLGKDPGRFSYIG
jgi:hypothetical protein